MKKIKDEVLHETEWLSFNRITALTKNNVEIKWDCVYRDKKIVTVICYSKGVYLLINQHRLPVDKVVLEFPTGLIDEGETIEQAGLRELKEETGYEGRIRHVHPFVAKSAGLSNEYMAILEVEVDDITQKGETALEEKEELTTMWMTAYEVKEYMKTADAVSIEVYLYFMGR